MVKLAAREKRTRMLPLTTDMFVESIASTAGRLMVRLPEDIRAAAFDQLIGRLAGLFGNGGNNPLKVKIFRPKPPGGSLRAGSLLPWPNEITTEPDILPPSNTS